MSKSEKPPETVGTADIQRCPFHAKTPVVGFDQLVTQIAESGALNDYPKPLGHSVARDFIDRDWVHNVRFPGDTSYGHGPATLMYHDYLPADLNTAQHRSFKTAINITMPQESMDMWMKQYFSQDFMHSETLKDLVNKVAFYDNPQDLLPDKLSFKFDDPDRKSTDRKLFTVEEINFTSRLCKAHPEIVIAVSAYLASFIDYLDEMQKATAHSAIDPAQKERIATVTAELMKSYKVSIGNFSNFILPAIAMAYYKNHNGKIDIKDPPTLKDFQEGMSFVYEKGAFEQVVAQKKEGAPPIKFRCPARGILMRSSSCDIGQESAPTAGENRVGMMGDAGKIFFGIYQKVSHEFNEERWVTNQLVRDVLNSLHRSEDPHFQNI